MDTIARYASRAAAPFLRISLGLLLVWIGGLKFADPTPVVELLAASLPFLAFDTFVYALGVLEVGAGILLFTGIALPWVSLALVGFFAGTLLIFLIAPGVTYGDMGFPFMTLAGEFLLKDLALMAGAIALLALEVQESAGERAVPAAAGGPSR